MYVAISLVVDIPGGFQRIILQTMLQRPSYQSNEERVPCDAFSKISLIFFSVKTLPSISNCVIKNSNISMSWYVIVCLSIQQGASVCLRLVRGQERLFPIHLASMMGDPNAVSLLKPGKDQCIWVGQALHLETLNKKSLANDNCNARVTASHRRENLTTIHCNQLVVFLLLLCCMIAP